MKGILFLFGFLIYFDQTILAQLEPLGWEQPYQKARVFIENKGQFDAFQTPEIGKIAYAIDFGSTRVFFGQKGIKYYFLEARQTAKSERDSLRALYATQVPLYKEKEQVVGKFAFKSDAFQIQFDACNPQSKLYAKG